MISLEKEEAILKALRAGKTYDAIKEECKVGTAVIAGVKRKYGLKMCKYATEGLKERRDEEFRRNWSSMLKLFKGVQWAKEADSNVKCVKLREGRFVIVGGEE